MDLPRQESGFIENFTALAAQHPSRPYFNFSGTDFTFGDMEGLSRKAIGWLRSFGVRRGDRIAIMMDSCPVTIAILLALAREGLTWVPINTRLRGEGLAYIATHCQPKYIIADYKYLATLADAGLTGSQLISVNPAEIPFEAGSLPAGDIPPPAGNELFAIMYTSGTTGPPKGVLITHAMMRYSAKAVALISDVQPGDVMFMWEPLFHIGGAQMLVLPMIRPVSLAIVERFSAGKFGQQVTHSKATQIHYLGGILEILMKAPVSPLDRQHNVRIAWGAGCSAAVWEAFESRFGLKIRECYGMSEASSITTANTRHVVGSVGSVLPWLGVDIRDEEGLTVPPGTRGEIVVTQREDGPLFRGYFRNPEVTDKVLRQGRLYTGDGGWLDGDGNLFFTGRLGDSVRHKGENISAWEVEHIANKHPQIEGSAMVGVPGELGEQDIMLFVQPRSGATVDPEALCQWLADQLAVYQVPRYVQFVDAFERTPSERIMKHKLVADPARRWDRLAKIRA
jgi:crotonobetaine/carnitine-CoA ligase